MPSSLAARTTRRSASTPRRWPSARGKPRAAAQRPLPSMMIATCKGTVRSGPSVAGAAAFDIIEIPAPVPKSRLRVSVSVSILRPLNGKDFLFLCCQQLIDLGNHRVGRLLHVIGQALLVVFGDLVVLLQLLDRIKPVAADVPDGDLGRFGVFMRDFHQFLAAFLVELRNPQT